MRKFFVFALLLFVHGTCKASVVLSGTVTSSNGLFTYNYSIDNTAGTTPVDYFAVVVARPPNQADLTPVPPNSFTSPVGWSFGIAVGGTNPVNGGLWEWQAGQPAQTIQPGSSLSGFSFTTDAAPTLSALDNYFFLSDTFDRIQVGNITAPDVAIANPIPESATWIMMIVGFAALGFSAYRQTPKPARMATSSIRL